MKHNKVALGLIFCLFFLWAISSNLLPTMIRQLMKTCELNTFEASFTESAYWLAYFVCPIPIAMFMRRYSYRVGIITGLLIAAMGGLLFFPAAMVKSYGVYLCIFFIIATGMCFLETAANPYVTVLGDAHTAPRRLNLAQSFNGLGAFISAMFLSKLVLSGNDFTRDTLPADYAEQLLKAVEQYQADMQQKHNGLREVRVADSHYNDEKDIEACRDTTLHLTYAFLLLCYGDSTQEEIVVPMVHHSDRWLMK